jgi:hypothetical protein
MNATKIKLKAVVLTAFMTAMLEQERQITGRDLAMVLDFDAEIAEAEARGFLDGDITTDVYELLDAIESIEDFPRLAFA